MADTIGGGDFGKCSDWGPLVPDGKRTVLCGKCMMMRDRWSRSHKDPLPVPMPPEVLAAEVMDA
jgi:hypothetical protein